MQRLVLQGRAHVAHPDGQRDGATELAATEAFRLVIAGPYRGDVVAVVAGEPGVLGFVGGAGLACDICAAQGQGAAAGALLDHIFQDAVEDVGGTAIHNTFGHSRCLRFARGARVGGCRSRAGCWLDGDPAVARRSQAIGGNYAIDHITRHPWRVGSEQGVAIAAFDLVDQVRRDLVAAVGKGAPAGGDFHRREGGGAQGQRQVRRQVRLVEAKARDVVDGLADAHGLQQTDRYQVT